MIKTFDQQITPSESVIRPTEQNIVGLFIEDAIGLIDSSGSRIEYSDFIFTASLATSLHSSSFFKYATSETASLFISSSVADEAENVDTTINVKIADTASFVIQAKEATSASYGDLTVQSASYVEASQYSPYPLTASSLSNIQIEEGPGGGYNIVVLKDNEILISGYDGTNHQLNGFISNTGVTGTQGTYAIGTSDGSYPTWTKVKNAFANLFALDNSGSLWVVGSNDFGQCGNGTTTDVGPYLTKISWFETNGWTVKDFWVNKNSWLNNNAARFRLSVWAYAESGSQKRGFAWGYNGGNGMLGVGDTSNQSVNTPTQFYSGSWPVINVQSADNRNTSHVIYQLETGSLAPISGTPQCNIGSAGNNLDGQLGGGVPITYAVFIGPSDNTGQQMSCDRNSSLTVSHFLGTNDPGNSAVLRVGKIFITGDGSGYQLSRNTTADNTSFTPARINISTDLSNIQKVQLGYKSWAAQSTTNRLWVAGTNNDGWWGDGSAANATTGYAKEIDLSALIPGAYNTLRDFWLISDPGGYSTLFINVAYQMRYPTDSGSLINWTKTYAAGYNGLGDTGTGDTSSQLLTFKEVKLPKYEYLVDVKRLGASSDFRAYVGVSNTGRIYTWGATKQEYSFPYVASTGGDYISTPVQLTDLNLR